MSLPISSQLFFITLWFGSWLHLCLRSLNISLCYLRENWHEVQETASGCPVPAFHANFSHKNPLTRSAPRLKQKSPRGPCTHNCIIPPRPPGATVPPHLDNGPLGSDHT